MARFVNATAMSQATLKDIKSRSKGIRIRDSQSDMENMLTDSSSSFAKTTVREAPRGSKQKPVLNDHSNEFGITFTKDTIRLSAIGLIKVSMVLPEFEKQLNLPTKPSEDENFRKRKHGFRDVGDKKNPIT